MAANVRVRFFLLFVLASAVAYPMLITYGRGTWPATWPGELEKLRSRAQTVGVATGIQETVSQIPFHNSSEFVEAWPHLVSLVQNGGVIVLKDSPSTFTILHLTAGVRVNIRRSKPPCLKIS